MSATHKKPEIKMSLRAMERARDGEWDRLRNQMSALTQTLERDPAEWIGEHPYTAAGSAALAGFVIAQLPLPRRSPKKPREEKPERKLDDDEKHPSGSDKLMTLLASLAQQYLTTPAANGAANEEDGMVVVADGGTVRGASFPSDFSTPPA